MVKVAYLFGSLNRGGTEVLMLDVCRSIRRLGLKGIGIYRKTGVLESAFKNSELPFFYLPTGKNVIQYILQLRRVLSNHGISIVHAQQPIDALFGLLACLGTRRKVILTIHGYDFDEGFWEKMLLRFILHTTYLNIFVSHIQSCYYIDKYKLTEKTQKVIYNGISFDKFEPYYKPEKNSDSNEIKLIDSSLREELNIPQEVLLIGTVGNFNSVRDHLVICYFLKQLNEVFQNFHFVFVGKQVDTCAYLYEDCVEFCTTNDLTNRVSFLGSRDDVPRILSQLDAFIYATNHDTFGIAVVEAMAMGIPVFVNDWEVMTEITGEGKYANLYKTKDTSELLRLFFAFLNNRVESSQIALLAAQFVRSQYNIERYIEKLNKLYIEI